MDNVRFIKNDETKAAAGVLPAHQGRSLQELSAELIRQRQAKRDFHVNPNGARLHFAPAAPAASALAFQAGNGAISARINDLAHRQIGSFVDIPAPYYDRLRENAPGLLAENVNHWFAKADPKPRLVRLLDGNLRAFLGSAYRPLDNADLAEIALPALFDAGLQIQSCEVTESRLYIKAIIPSQEAEIRGSKRVGDVVQNGLVIQNSEVGLGSLSVSRYIWALYCLNGAIAQSVLRQAHVGKRTTLGDLDLAVERYSDSTRKLEDAALWSKFRDTLAFVAGADGFHQWVEAASEATERKVADPVKAIDAVAVQLSLNQTEKSSVLRHLIEGGDLSAWGVTNAITAAAKDAASYDRVTELQRLGAQVIELPKNDWERIAKAA